MRKFESMKQESQKNTKTLPGIPALILGGLISLGLYLLRYFNILYLDLEIVLAPFIVIALLAYSDKFLLIIFSGPIRFVSKIGSRLKFSSPSSKQHVTLSDPTYEGKN